MYQPLAMTLITNHYGSRCAERSGVPLINHINEGLRILDHIRASSEAKVAFILHPLFQHDDDLATHNHLLPLFDSWIVALVMEYRNVANRSLSDRVSAKIEWDATNPLKLSPIDEVNMMLIADKVQNRKDFLIYHKGTHPRSEELDFYFRNWIDKLGVDEAQYEELVRIAKEK